MILVQKEIIMKKSILLLITILSLLITSSYNLAQAQDNGSNQALMEGGGSFLVTLNQKNKKAIGSPYIYKDFAPAKISATQNEIYNVRYNAFTDEIEIKVGEDKVQNFNKNLSNVVITFLNDNVKFTTLNYINSDDGLERGYFVSLTESNDKVKLFSKKQIKYFEAKPAKTSYDNDKPAEFKNVNDTHFISINDAYARELPTNKKSIAKMFPKNSKDILNFIKKNKIKTSREADMVNLINYINTL